MTTIIKDKNELHFVREDGKYWGIDLNNGTLTGFSGKTVKRVPNGGYALIRDYKEVPHETNDLAIILTHYLAKYGIIALSYMQFLESMYNAQNIHFDFFSSDFDYNMFLLSRIEPQGKAAFQKCVSVAKRNFEPREQQYSLFDLYNFIEEQKFYALYKDLVDRYGMEAVKEANDYFNSDINDMKMYLYYRYNDKTLQVLIDNDWLSERMIEYYIADMLKWCKEMQITPHKAPLLTEYKIMKDAHHAWVAKNRQNAFQKTQNPAFGFTYGNYIAIVPTTVEECVQEGQYMRNCLGGYWLSHYGNTCESFSRGVVFIREVKTNKSVVSCDFDLATMKIRQFLGKNNTTVRDQELLQFKELLQEHLYEFKGN